MGRGSVVAGKRRQWRREASSFPRRLKRREGDKEKTAAKKSPPHEVLLIRSAVPRFSDHRHLPLLLPLSRRSQAAAW
ncbi:hypothetical protein BHM03_00003995 [Ensete ventricosum]|nr:hypothetical protein BHM03_00003995 [Ensete ventricosum]